MEKSTILLQKVLIVHYQLSKKNKAANELQQLKGEDPLPLRKAKINQEATVRKCEKATKAVEAQTKIVQDAKHKQEELVASVHKKTEEAKQKTLQVEESKRQQEELVAAVHQKTEEAKEKTKEVEAAKHDADQKKQKLNPQRKKRSKNSKRPLTSWKRPKRNLVQLLELSGTWIVN